MEGPLLGPHHHQGPCSVCGKVSNLEQTVAGLSGRGLSHYQRATSGSLRGGFFLPTSGESPPPLFPPIMGRVPCCQKIQERIEREREGGRNVALNGSMP